MGFTSKIIVMLVGNGLGLYVASRYVPGFIVPIDLEGLLIASLVLTAINLFLRPLLKIVLSPLIIITLGLGIILVNLATLYLLDYFLVSVTISGLVPLIIGTLVLGAINFVIHVTSKIV
jgi:putative membrane protein